MYNPTNYAYIRPIQEAPLDLIGQLTKGMQAGAMPRDIAQRQTKAALNNAILAVGAKYAEPDAAAKLRGMDLSNQTSATNLQYLPQLLQGRVTGENLANATSSENLKYLPQMTQAKLALMAAQTNKMNDKTVSPFALSPIGKIYREMDNLKQGLSADGSHAIDPAEAADELNGYEGQLIKQNATAKQRNQLSQGGLAEITLNSIDPNALTIYSGPQGKMLYAQDVASANSGKPSQRWQAYQSNLIRAQTLAKQYVGTYGLSVQPSQLDMINKMINSSSLTMDPNTAAIGFNTFASGLRSEMAALRGQILDPTKLLQPQNTDFFGRQNSPDNAAGVPAGVQGSTGNGSDTITIKNPNTGQTVTISKAEYLANGGKL